MPVPPDSRNSPSRYGHIPGSRKAHWPHTSPNETEAPGHSAYSRTTLTSHPDGRCAPLFDPLRTELLALDPNIGEEILKLYIAYKAETNVVDVVPQASRLRLSLIMPFPELLDPKALARDVTNLGRWGNGDVEIGLSTVEEIPYVLGLVRQFLDLQLSNAIEDTV